ncbi:MAG TPA: hypothetical protein VNM68_02785 [Candidatus Polarisedimenticolia bacterium]|nr:hypothetical protein [Candidatus Polarisedimenticolia bacterium]
MDLVSSLDPSAPSAAPAGPALAWRGDDPVIFSRVLAALQTAEIPTHQIVDHDQFAFQPGILRPCYGIFVRREDAPRVEEIVRWAIEGEPTE